MNIKNYLWSLPFCCFLLGYSLTRWFFHVDSISTPHLVGKHVHEILPILSQHKFSLRLIDQKEEADIPEGIILSQIPHPNKAIKPNQPIFIVTTKKPSAIKTPLCLKKNLDTLLPELQKIGINPRIYKLAHPYSQNLCFAQCPQAEELLEKNKLILYVSTGNEKPIIWPSFIGTPLEEVINFLHTYNIQPYVINNSPNLDTAIASHNIIDQRPSAGTLITLDEKNPLSVQLRIR